jgi:hypothetical protein
MSVRHDCAGGRGAGAGHARQNLETNFLPRPRLHQDNSRAPAVRTKPGRSSSEVPTVWTRGRAATQRRSCVAINPPLAATFWWCGAQHSQVATATDLHTLTDRLDWRTRRRCFANGVCQCLKVVGGRFLARRERQPDDVPAPGRRQPVSMRAAQVVAMRFYVGGKRPEHRRRVSVHIGKRAYGIPFASRPGAAARTQ